MRKDSVQGAKEALDKIFFFIFFPFPSFKNEG